MTERRTLVIPQPTGEPVWWDDPLQAEYLDHFILSRRALGHQFEGGLLIIGPAGSGQNQSVPMALRRINASHGLSLRLTKMDCATVTDPQKWFGRRELTAGETKYVRSTFVEATERGDIVLLDEINRLHPYLHDPIMALLDGFNAVEISDLNVTISRHPETVFIATANIGVQYGGTHRLDHAMRRRFPFALERPWPPRDIEIKILASRTGCDEDGAANLVDVAIKSRQMYESGDLRLPVDTATLISAAWGVASGMSEREALSITALPLYDPDANGLAGTESERQKFRGVLGRKIWPWQVSGPTEPS